MITKVTILKVNRFAIHIDFFFQPQSLSFIFGICQEWRAIISRFLQPNTVCYDAMKAPSTIPNVVIPELKSHDTLN